MATLRTLRTRPPERKRGSIGFGIGLIEHFGALRSPLPLHDQRQAVDDHIEEAANDQAKQHGYANEQRRPIYQQLPKSHGMLVVRLRRLT